MSTEAIARRFSTLRVDGPIRGASSAVGEEGERCECERSSTLGSGSAVFGRPSLRIIRPTHDGSVFTIFSSNPLNCPAQWTSRVFDCGNARSSGTKNVCDDVADALGSRENSDVREPMRAFPFAPNSTKPLEPGGLHSGLPAISSRSSADSSLWAMEGSQLRSPSSLPEFQRRFVRERT